MKKIALLLATVLLLLTACQPSLASLPAASPLSGPGASSPAPNETDPVPTESAPVSTKPNPTPTETNPVPTENPLQAELDQFTKLFGDDHSWYSRALTTLYETPTQMSLFHFFNNGIPGVSNELSDIEREQLGQLPGYYHELDTYRLPVDKMDEILKQHFGVSLADMQRDSFRALYYLESQNCYYSNIGGGSWISDFAATAIETQADGTVLLTYTRDNKDEPYQVGLKPVGDGYQILFNRKLLDETAYS